MAAAEPMILGRDPRFPATPARAEGAFLAFAAGDALGWPQEVLRRVRAPRPLPARSAGFTRWTRRSGDRFRPFDEEIAAGEYSDDTQLTLAVARSRANHRRAWWEAFTGAELPLWRLYERGGGGATLRAAKAWAESRPPWESTRPADVARYFEAGGNGAAMRVLPHAVTLAARSVEEVVADAVRDGMATHGSPRALLGAAAYAYAAWFLLNRNAPLRSGELVDALLDGRQSWGCLPNAAAAPSGWATAAESAVSGYESAWRRVSEEMASLLSVARRGVRDSPRSDDREVLETLGCFSREKGAGTVSAAAAAYLASRDAAGPAAAVVRAAFERPGDTDTLAAMTGGLLGCLLGTDWLPAEWRAVQDAAYLRALASRVAAGPERAADAPIERAPQRGELVAHLVRRGGEELSFGAVFRARAAVWDGARAATRSLRVRSWRLAAAEGQTFYIHHRERIALPKASRPPAHSFEASSPDPSHSLPLTRGFLRAANLRSGVSAGAPGLLREEYPPFVVLRDLARQVAQHLVRNGAGPDVLRCVPDEGVSDVSLNGRFVARIPSQEENALLRYVGHLFDKGGLPPVTLQLVEVADSPLVFRVLVAEPDLPPVSTGLLIERIVDGRRFYALERDPTRTLERFDLDLLRRLTFDSREDAASILIAVCSRLSV